MSAVSIIGITTVWAFFIANPFAVSAAVEGVIVAGNVVIFAFIFVTNGIVSDFSFHAASEERGEGEGEIIKLSDHIPTSIGAMFCGKAEQERDEKKSEFSVRQKKACTRERILRIVCTRERACRGQYIEFR